MTPTETSTTARPVPSDKAGKVPDGPLSGLVVVDLSTTLPGAFATQFLADCGAEVTMVEPVDGSSLRELSGWPALLRGKRSVTADLTDDGGRARLWELLERADVVVSTLSPSATERLGLTEQLLGERFPRLVAATITGWGWTGPWRDYKGWEGLVMAKTGVMHNRRVLNLPARPAFTTVPYASWAAGHAAVQGIVAALIERDNSGRGQFVRADLVASMAAMDPYNWFYEMVLQRYPGAFQRMDAFCDDLGRPQQMLVYALLVGPTRDRKWLQFAQVSPRLMQAWLAELNLTAELADPKWDGFPALATPELRMQWWDMMLERVADRTLDEWLDAFDSNHDLSGELFRTPEESFEHPQTIHDQRTMVIDQPGLGSVRQVSTLIHSGRSPLATPSAAPQIGQHDAEPVPIGSEPPKVPAPLADAPTAPPLSGVTILELGSMYAGPFGATMLADLGARVIKVEPLDGDEIRKLVAFPEAGGAKVLQGKESVAIDFSQPEGLELVYELAKRCDVVLQCFRGAAAKRARIDDASLKAVNPGLVVLSTSGYGVDGPFAHRAAYAPTIGAASGITMVDTRYAARPTSSAVDVHRNAAKLHAGGVSSVQPDGIAAFGVASSLMVGIYAKRHGIVIPGMVTTMLAAAQHAVMQFNTTYQDRPPVRTVDEDFCGMGALYRMYAAADGWVFLAAPLPREWAALTKAMSSYVDLDADERFGTAALRALNDAALQEVLATVFASKAKLEWEHELTAQDVGCVEVAEANIESVLQSDGAYDAGYCVDAYSPIFDHHRRLAPACGFTRSETIARGGCTIGQHTDAVLHEIGLSDAQISGLRERSVIGG